MDAISELAMLFKERENVIYMGPQTGTVISPLPNIKVSLGEKIILDKEELIISAHVLAGYQREMEITNIKSTGFSSDSGDIDFHLTGSPPPKNYTITGLSIPQSSTMKSEGTLKYTDTLKVGDQVILIPSSDNQKYYLIDKAVKL
ncbi:hypothetical protein HNQ80_003622 [Anaerosolibacter carboniphilus]|uniref:DUF2577 domain-containing protein n=1 Tax=Anaerosolibacter carboniphilus TaxID=1417629 RepID=A0A841KVP4_9FIRM|nr:DUF2577 domain-containing protein [Anaerosolibacter carboniphilus]MBB6217501.1 hypothetical protein [Anaerosolibacter carboniphilus]